MSKLQKTSKALVNLVDGIGVLGHGGWRDDNGQRLKDTEEWVAFYVQSNRFPSGDPVDLMEFIEEKGLLEELKLWLSGPMPPEAHDISPTGR